MLRDNTLGLYDGRSPTLLQTKKDIAIVLESTLFSNGQMRSNEGSNRQQGFSCVPRKRGAL